MASSWMAESPQALDGEQSRATAWLSWLARQDFEGSAAFRSALASLASSSCGLQAGGCCSPAWCVGGLGMR
jgi:hypothetical protein